MGESAIQRALAVVDQWREDVGSGEKGKDAMNCNIGRNWGSLFGDKFAKGRRKEQLAVCEQLDSSLFRDLPGELKGSLDLLPAKERRCTFLRAFYPHSTTEEQAGMALYLLTCPSESEQLAEADDR